MAERGAIIDFYAGGGGTARGLRQAGFQVVGVDVRFEGAKYYPGPYIAADACEVGWLLAHGGRVRATDKRWYARNDFVGAWASPPCQMYSVATPEERRDQHPDLVATTRAMLCGLALPWVMENVPGAPLNGTLVLCGTMFGLRVLRHRVFEGWRPLWALQPPHPCLQRATQRHGFVCVVGSHPVTNLHHHRRQEQATGKRPEVLVAVEEARAAMGIDDALPWRLLKLAVPPAYARHCAQAYLWASQ